MERQSNGDIRTDQGRIHKLGGKVRGKMPVSERAKQFMPFAAVSGLDTALEKTLKEHRLTHSGLYYQEEAQEEVQEEV